MTSEQIKDFRSRYKLTLKQLGKLLGVSAARAWQIENNPFTPTDRYPLLELCLKIDHDKEGAKRRLKIAQNARKDSEMMEVLLTQMKRLDEIEKKLLM